ncbi:MAG: sugar transferase, partial [Lachnospiraceae bacterium]|nr:sugar transferase [Lachnospiraceae bacterium]
MRRVESFKRMILFLMSTVCIAFQTKVYMEVWYGYYAAHIWKPYHAKGHIVMIAFYAVLLLFFSKIYGGLKIGYLKTTEVMFSQIFATICVNVITYVQIVLLSLKFVPLVPMLKLTLVEFLG